VAAPAASRAWWRGDAPIAPSGDTSGATDAANIQGAIDELAGHDFRKATHLKTEGICPECSSGNLAPTGKVTTKHGVVEATRCFDCGWPVAHSTRGLGGLAGEKADGASRQVATGGTVNNYQPQNTVAGAIRKASDLR
jgi:hypothetical protein